MLSSDTSSEARWVQIEVYRRMPGAHRLALAVEMSEQVNALAKTGIRDRHPTYDESAAEWAARRQRLGDELFRAAFPDAPMLAP